MAIYELLFSDNQMGHSELGWMPRDRRALDSGDTFAIDDEDLAYQRFLKARGITARVYGGCAEVSS